MGKRRVLVVVAHPDDECMFFGPTICNLSEDVHTSVYLLCLSTGNYYGKGKERKAELYQSCEILGIPNSNIMISNHKDLQDGMGNHWDSELIGDIVEKHVVDWEINWIVTFDDYGVSGHPNHKALFVGVQQLMESGKLPSSVEMYALHSIGMLRKYTSFLDVFYSYAVACMSSDAVFFSSFKNVWKAQRAMFAHYSQLKWFRLLYIIFSRYMIVNTLYPVLPIHQHDE